jgi:threonine synthase
MVYYAIAIKQAVQNGAELKFSIPSGNYGNITAGILLHEMGLKMDLFIAAHNANDTIPRYLQSGIYAPGSTIQTFANAMDVSDPGNFIRLKYLLENDPELMDEHFVATSISDEEILKSIKKCWEEHAYLLDPHTATAWQALNENGSKGIILATAHPFKFEEVIKKALGYYPADWKKEWQPGKIEKVEIEVDYEEVKKLLRGSL